MGNPERTRCDFFPGEFLQEHNLCTVHCCISINNTTLIGLLGTRHIWHKPLKAIKTLNCQLQGREHRSVIAHPGGQCLAQKDKKAIPITNTLCKPSSITMVKWKKDGTWITVACPEAVQKYNAYMGGVDISDQIRKAHSCKRRSLKWWLPLFYLLVDNSVVNSHIFAMKPQTVPNVP